MLDFVVRGCVHVSREAVQQRWQSTSISDGSAIFLSVVLAYLVVFTTILVIALDSLRLAAGKRVDSDVENRT